MVDALRDDVGTEEKRGQLRREASLAWGDYQENGVQVSGDEAIAGLKTWGGDDEQKRARPPQLTGGGKKKPAFKIPRPHWIPVQI